MKRLQDDKKRVADDDSVNERDMLSKDEETANREMLSDEGEDKADTPGIWFMTKRTLSYVFRTAWKEKRFVYFLYFIKFVGAVL